MECLSNAVALLMALSRYTQAADDTELVFLHDQLRGRDLSVVETNCLGSSLNRGDTISVGESIGTEVNGEAVYFGIWAYTMSTSTEFTTFSVEIRSEQGTFDRRFSSLGTDGPAPALKLQGDGHLVFGGQGFSNCVAKPATRGREKRLIFKEEDGKPILMTFDDTEGDLIWKLDGPSCYPDTPDSCISTLSKHHRLSWQDYVCQYDSEGKVSFKFGLSEDGLLGLWRDGELIWRPSGGNLRGDYLHFQDDGHLTLYRDTTPKTYKWTSDDCIDYTASKLTLSGDGDVMETNESGAIVWTLRGSELEGVPAPSDPRDSVEEVCMPGCVPIDSCVPPNVPLFQIDKDVDIGDTLIRPGPVFAKRCGPRCYDVKDNGDDPPFDPELGDTLRFAYKKVSSYNFLFRSLVCGTVCDGRDTGMNKFGRTGLMVRESLDPLAMNVFASHQRDAQADWSYRTRYGELPTTGFDGSPDVECLWITLERDQNDFTFSYAYPSGEQDQCDIDGDFLEHLTTTVTINMSEQILVGLGVSTAIAPPFCSFTEARFANIEFRAY
jgi:hypothetical protein